MTDHNTVKSVIFGLKNEINNVKLNAREEASEIDSNIRGNGREFSKTSNQSGMKQHSELPACLDGKNETYREAYIIRSELQ